MMTEYGQSYVSMYVCMMFEHTWGIINQDGYDNYDGDMINNDRL